MKAVIIKFCEENHLYRPGHYTIGKYDFDINDDGTIYIRKPFF